MSNTRKTKGFARGAAKTTPVTLADVLIALEHGSTISATRLRDLRSAVQRVAGLLGQEPAGIPLDLPVISTKLAIVNPIAVGVSAKTLANLRSGFLTAVKLSGLKAVQRSADTPLSPAWASLMAHLSGKRAHLGLSRLARYASAKGIDPEQINDAAIEGFITAVREGSLHRKPNDLHRQVTLIWNEVAKLSGFQSITVASFRPPAKRVEWTHLTSSFQKDAEGHLTWCGGSDPFAADARSRALAPRTLRLRRDQIHAAVTALVESGVKPSAIMSLADLLSPENFKRILRRRLEAVGGRENNFNRDLAEALVQIGREWVKLEPSVLTELKRLTSKVPMLATGLTPKNKAALRQFDDPAVLGRLIDLPGRLWAEVKREAKPNFRTLAKAQAALGVAILSYMPLRPGNLAALTFGVHLFMGEGARATSTLEMPAGEVKNETELAFDIPPQVAKMLVEYRERIAPKVIGRRPERVFVNADGTPKSQSTVAWLIKTYLGRRAGIVLTPHQFRHLSAKIMLDLEPGSFETVSQLLGHKSQDDRQLLCRHQYAPRGPPPPSPHREDPRGPKAHGPTQETAPAVRGRQRPKRPQMTRAPNMQLPYDTWPEEDRKRWSAANKPGADPFDDCGPAAHLAEPSRRALQASYGRFLGFVAAKHSLLLELPPENRLDRAIIADYVGFRRQSCGQSGIAIDLHHLRLALRYICPATNWSWLAIITKRIANTAKSKPPKHHLVTSERLYALGIELMDRAVANAAATTGISKADAFDYRDGLMLALPALVPLRRRTLAALHIGQQLLKSGDLWDLDIPAQDIKTRRPLDYPISPDLSRRIDLYLAKFRRRIPGAARHDGLWPSNQGRPMGAGTIYDTVRRRTREAFGFPINLHRFRHAAGTLWSIYDPVNVRGVKDLLGHASFDTTTEKHYIMTQSRLAGRALARAIDTARKRPSVS